VWILIDFERGLIGYGSFKICDVKKTFADKTSSGNFIFSPGINIFGIKWYVGLVNNNNQFFGIYLCRENKVKI
jgi:hypothetical protein